jgi:hypothetical protein
MYTVLNLKLQAACLGRAVAWSTCERMVGLGLCVHIVCFTIRHHHEQEGDTSAVRLQDLLAK